MLAFRVTRTAATTITAGVDAIQPAEKTAVDGAWIAARGRETQNDQRA